MTLWFIYEEGVQPSAADLRSQKWKCASGVTYHKGPVVVNVLPSVAEHCLVTTGSPPLSLVTRIGCVNTERNAAERAHPHGYNLLGSHRASTVFSVLQFFFWPCRVEGVVLRKINLSRLLVLRLVATSPRQPKPKPGLDNAKGNLNFREEFQRPLAGDNYRQNI